MIGAEPTASFVDLDRIEAIAARLDLRPPNKEALESIVFEVGQHFVVDREPPPFEAVVALATGVGKTYVLAAAVEYFAAEDWELTVEFANAREVEGHCALSSVNEACQEARIRILDEAEWPIPSDRVGIWHLEYFLIHELVHLHVMAWKGPAASDHDSLEYQQKERAIDLMAGALWRLERGERR